MCPPPINPQHVYVRVLGPLEEILAAIHFSEVGLI